MKRGGSGHSRPFDIAIGRLPYFDDVLDALASPNAEIIAALVNDMHWGIFEPGETVDSPASQIAGAQRMTEQVCASANLSDDATVLDLGCGFGGTLRHLNERLSEATLLGLNIDRRQLRFIQDHVRPQRGNGIHLIHGEGSTIALRSRRIDAIIAIESLFHLDSRGRFFREAQRLLTNDGRLVVTDFVLDESFRLVDLGAIDRSAQAHLRRFFGHSPGGHVSLRRYERHANAVGLRLTVNQDLTAQILPSFDGLAALYKLISGEVAGRALQVLHELTLRGLMRYRLLAFGR